MAAGAGNYKANVNYEKFIEVVMENAKLKHSLKKVMTLRKNTQITEDDWAEIEKDVNELLK